MQVESLLGKVQGDPESPQPRSPPQLYVVLQLAAHGEFVG